MTSSQPLLDEESPTAAAASYGTKKFYVPSSDRRLVLSAIDNQLNLAKDEWGEKHFNSDQTQHPLKHNGNNYLIAKGEFFMNCINQTGAALQRKLELVTAPAEEDEVESILDSFRTRLATANLRNANIISPDYENEDLVSSSDEDDEKSFEFDDDDIIDAEAYHQVKQLRSQARDIASRVVSVRNDTVERAMSMTQRNLVELMRVHGFDNDTAQGEEGSGDIIEQQAEGREKATADAEMQSSNETDVLNPLRVSLRTLASSLRHVNSNLGENIESLKETIGTIDSSVEKIQRHLQGDESALSSTEKALLASSNVNPEEETVLLVMGGDDEISAAKDKTESAMYPDKKLAHLLAGIL